MTGYWPLIPNQEKSGRPRQGQSEPEPPRAEEYSGDRPMGCVAERDDISAAPSRTFPRVEWEWMEREGLRAVPGLNFQSGRMSRAVVPVCEQVYAKRANFIVRFFRFKAKKL